jgi:rare lipoprotein A
MGDMLVGSGVGGNMGALKGLMVGRVTRFGTLVGALLTVTACSSSDPIRTTVAARTTVSEIVPITPPPARIADTGEPITKVKGTYKVGEPYTINGQTYFPAADAKYRAEGIASWYGPDFHGKETANGEIYDMNGISAAHTTMPIPSYARVTNLANGRSIVVRVNDRGPFVDNRVIDLSVGSAKALDTYAKGLARVRVEYVSPAPLQGSDDTVLLATLRHGKPAPPPSLVMVASAKPAAGSKSSGSRSAPDGQSSTAPAGMGGPLVLSSVSSQPVSPGRSAESPADRRGRSGGPARPDGDGSISWSLPGQGLLTPDAESLGIVGGRGLY